MSLWQTVSSWIYWTSPEKEPVYGPGRNAPESFSLKNELDNTVLLGKVSYPKFVVLTQEELDRCIKSLRPAPHREEKKKFKVEGVLGELEELFLQGVSSRLRKVSPRRKEPLSNPEEISRLMTKRRLENEEEDSEW